MTQKQMDIITAETVKMLSDIYQMLPDGYDFHIGVDKDGRISMSSMKWEINEKNIQQKKRRYLIERSVNGEQSFDMTDNMNKFLQENDLFLEEKEKTPA